MLEGFSLFLTQLESWAPLVSCRFMHNSSAVTHRSRSRSESAGANPPPKGLFSLTLSKPSAFLLVLVCSLDDDQIYTEHPLSTINQLNPGS